MVVGEWMTLRNCLLKEEAQQMHIIDYIDGYLHGIHSFDYVVLWATVERGKSSKVRVCDQNDGKIARRIEMFVAVRRKIIPGVPISFEQ